MIDESEIEESNLGFLEVDTVDGHLKWKDLNVS